jgi:hypothetical protein
MLSVEVLKAASTRQGGRREEVSSRSFDSCDVTRLTRKGCCFTLLAPHTHEPRDVSRRGALSLLQKPLITGKIW